MCVEPCTPWAYILLPLEASARVSASRAALPFAKVTLWAAAVRLSIDTWPRGRAAGAFFEEAATAAGTVDPRAATVHVVWLPFLVAQKRCARTGSSKFARRKAPRVRGLMALQTQSSFEA